MENGILVEHWDVIQDEATREQSKSKLPMFGSSSRLCQTGEHEWIICSTLQLRRTAD